MGAQGIRLPDRAFWDRYLTLLQAAGIKPDQARWYVLRVEQHTRTDKRPAVGNGASDPKSRYGWRCAEIGRSGTAISRCSKPLASSLTRPEGMSYRSSNILRHIPISPSVITDPNT